MKLRAMVGAAVTSVVLVGAVATASPAAAVADVTVTSPAALALASGSSPVSGSAASPAGVAAVDVAAMRLADNQWLQADGSFGPAPSFVSSALGAPGQAATTWSVVLALPPGDVTVVARATATDGTIGDAATTFRVATRPMLTLQLGRAMLGQSAQCQLLPGQPTIFDVATELRNRGLFAVGVVVPDRTDDAAARCANGNLYPSWVELARLRDEFGWSFVSNGQARLDLPGLDRRSQIVESCGSLDAFASRGHLRAWGLFGPNSNQITDAIATDVLNRCFAFTRLYSGAITEQQGLAAPYYERVRVAGGGRGGGYDPPAELLARIGTVGDGAWLSLGSYKFVVGERSGSSGPQWSCTSSDPSAHWSSDDEVYCWNDYLAILDALAPQQLEPVDPATVAERWGRVPAVEVDQFSVTGDALGQLEVSFTAYESGDYWLVADGTCSGGGSVVGAGTSRAAVATATALPTAALPAGTVALRLCLRNAFGRVGWADATVVT